MTAPLTPADCDLKSFEYMPLDVQRLRDSRLALAGSGDEFTATIMLWCASWHEIPAASIPNDAIELARMSGARRRWRRIKNAVLRDWVLCDDGRLYHPVVAAMAMRAWTSRGRILTRVDRRLQIVSQEWADIRRKVFERDNFTCQYCRTRGGYLECDHVLPVAKGGATNEENLTTACLSCNRSKGGRFLAAWLAQR